MDEHDGHDGLAEVVQLPSAREFNRNAREAELDENAPVQQVPYQLGDARCKHKGTFVDFANRRIHCRDCKTELDPYKVLDDLAHAREGLIRTAQRYRHEIRHSRDELAELHRQERNAKERVKRARKWLKANAGRVWADLGSDDDLFRDDPFDAF